MRLLDVTPMITYQSHHHPSDSYTIYGQPLYLLTSPESRYSKREEVHLWCQNESKYLSLKCQKGQVPNYLLMF